MTRRQGSIMVIVGGFVFLAAQTFLPYIEIGRIHRTYWDFGTRVPVILTAIGVAAVAFAIASLRTDAVIVAPAAAACSFFLLGRVLPLGYKNYSGVGIGLWLASGATVVMSIGGLVALTGRASFANRFAKPS